ncbi:hypothetical protein CPB84DRAFT_331601 [Gymnopilus junonius]|uniref:Uncharacterized protein n=1 Tax=Gymnopilus junonius TaxID=109634 RepID=A0A9P5TGI9_GYMJU|nr:hypothetical protein CPB84DRAFT_331601 [Gymnopilus junonius]
MHLLSRDSTLGRFRQNLVLLCCQLVGVAIQAMTGVASGTNCPCSSGKNLLYYWGSLGVDETGVTKVVDIIEDEPEAY